ncbi:hypothetical protein [Stenotrophomonas maltophilia]|uniref:hypothetical protein n=1 Tax=Stenotrophomonas maltophilia TaxID=40324 RepID=UPI000B131CCB|nr:hypothetical protein [Stenotrophomonas maltophilia]
MLLCVRQLSARAAARYCLTPGLGSAALHVASEPLLVTAESESGVGHEGGPPLCVPRRAHSSPRHACALHGVLFLHHLHAGLRQPQQRYQWHGKAGDFPADPCAKDVANDTIEPAKGHQFGSNLVGVENDVQERPRRNPSLLRVFQESYEMRVWNAFLVTHPAQAPLPHPSADSPVSQGFRAYPCLLSAPYLPDDISDSLFLLVTLVRWLHTPLSSYISMACD